MNLRDSAIGNIEKIMSDFVDEKISEKKKREIAAMMSAVAVSAFRLGFQAAWPQEMTEEQFNEMLYSKADERKVGEKLSEIVFRVRM